VSTWRRGIVLAAVALLLAAGGAAAVPVRQLLGPIASTWLWLPATLSAVSLLLLGSGHRGLSATFGLVGRLAFLALIVAFVADPSANAFDRAIDAFRLGADAAGEAVKKVVLGAVGVVFVGYVVTQVMAPAQDSPRTKTTVSSSTGAHPVVGLVLRAVVRLLLLGIGGAIWLGVMAAAWVVLGWWRLRLAISDEGVSARVLAVLLERRRATLAAAYGLVGGAWTTGRRTSQLGVWVRPAWLARAADLSVEDQGTWERTNTAEDTELAELGRGIIAAYDVALQPGNHHAGGQQGRDPRAGPPLGPYRIEVTRAWSRPDFHALVVTISPAVAAAAGAKVGLDQIVPVLDAHTAWTSEDLRSLHLSDRRVAADPLRDGAVGLFIALDRGPMVTAPANPDPVIAAVDRALGEAGLRSRFRLIGREEGIDADTIEFRSSFRTSAEWADLERAWKGLQPAVALFARSPAVRLETRLDPYSFVALVPKPAAEFPTGEAVDWTRVFERYEPALRRHPLRFILGLDSRGEPVHVELGHETPHLLIAGGTGSGKSRSAVFSPLLQLLELNPPDRLGLWILDSVKRELTSLFGDAPHIRHAVIAEDADAVVATIERFAAEMDARYRELAGRDFDPAKGQSQLLIIEEWADLVLLLEKSDLERVVKSLARIGQIGRAGGHHLAVITQRASADVIRKSNFKGRISGYFPSASDYGIVFDHHRRLLPNIKGRLAWSAGGEIVVCQGLYADNDTIRRRIAGLSGRRPASPPKTREHWPTQAVIDRLDDSTLVRLLYEWDALDGPDLTITVRGLADRIRALGLTPGRTERLTDGLSRLEVAGLLGRASNGPTAPRRLVLASIDAALARVERRPDGR
jgi:hypothetical protein